VILVDVNVLLYAHDSSSPHHASCAAWTRAAMSGVERIGLPWQTVLGFMRIATSPRVYLNPLDLAGACERIDQWLSHSHVAICEPGARYWSILRALLAESRATGPLVPDAALAALALEQGAAVCTTDRDFRRFRGLRIVDPTTPE
jgi:hypothetical protein